MAFVLPSCGFQGLFAVFSTDHFGNGFVVEFPVPDDEPQGRNEVVELAEEQDGDENVEFERGIAGAFPFVPQVVRPVEVQ